MAIVVSGKIVKPNLKNLIGKGGEADLFDIGGRRALKIFKSPSHPDYSNNPLEQQAAADRLREHQTKLAGFPSGLPDNVVVPEELAYDDKNGSVIGYVMSLVQNATVLMRYGDRGFRQHGVSAGDICPIFERLYGILTALHALDIVIGDFNDLNVLISNDAPFLIDADSFQFGPYQCRMFSEKFVDPLLSDSTAKYLQLTKPHNRDSDWYAYAVMLMRSLVYVDPYGGVYKPPQGSAPISPAERPLKRITVFHPDVRYPKPALPLATLPDELLHFFSDTFIHDKREPFDLNLLRGIDWLTCSDCGTEHARNSCPVCHVPATRLLPPKIVSAGVEVVELFECSGLILKAAYQNGRLRVLFHEDGEFRREDGLTVLRGDLSPTLRFDISARNTVLVRQNRLLIPGKLDVPQLLDNGPLPSTFQATAESFYWLSGGALLKLEDNGIKQIGQVLQNQTIFWMGPKFGFGFSRALELQLGFVFSNHINSINDSIELPKISGQLTKADCALSGTRAWTLIDSVVAGKAQRTLLAVDNTGQVLGSWSSNDDRYRWLFDLGTLCAIGDILLSATDRGIVRIEIDHTLLAITREFPATEPWIDSSIGLLAGEDALLAVGTRRILSMKLN